MFIFFLALLFFMSSIFVIFPQIVMLLLEYGAKPDSPDAEGRWALFAL